MKTLRNKNLAGFTLIELLVVIVIIGMIMAILIPVVGKARSYAKSALCCNNLRQIFLAAIMFRDDKGWYPRSYLTTPDSGPSWIEPEPDFFPAYLDGDKGVLHCPEVKGYFNDEEPVYSYGYFWYKSDGAKVGTIFPPEMEGDASNIPMFADSGSPIISNQYVLDFLLRMYNQQASPAYPLNFNGDGVIDATDLAKVLATYSGDGGGYAYRHGNRANIIYLDGHSANVKKPEPPPPKPPEPEE